MKKMVTICDYCNKQANVLKLVVPVEKVTRTYSDMEVHTERKFVSVKAEFSDECLDKVFCTLKLENGMTSEGKKFSWKQCTKRN